MTAILHKRNILIGLVVCFLANLIFALPVIADTAVNQYGIRSKNPYVAKRFIYKGKTVDMVVAPSCPTPPKGVVRQVAKAPEPNIAMGVNSIPNVPALTWCFGCAATSAAMLFGHYDNAGYPNMYTGPTNGGVFPMNNDTYWPTVVINGETLHQCPLSATRNGLDERTTRGHVDDYWVKNGDSGPDPYITNGWIEHTPGDCTGDFMGTSQSKFNNSDGSTCFYLYPDGSPCYDFTGGRPYCRDGGHGLKLFVESRGYTVQTVYNQYIYGYNGLTQGFTFSDFKREIDAGHPVLIHVEGHTMLGFGYDDSTNTIYIHDTWDHKDHTMTWGGSYSGRKQVGVTVLHLARSTPPPQTTLGITVKPTSGRPGDKVTVPLILSYATGSTANIVKAQCDITYNASALENPTVSLGPSSRAMGESVSGVAAGNNYRITVSGGSGALPAGTIAYVTFTIKTGATTGGTSSFTNVPWGWDSSSNLVIDPNINPSFITATTVTLSRVHIFSDVTPGNWAENYINQIYYNGITTGYGNGTYGPRDNVTRAQMAAFLIRPLRGNDFTYPSSPYFSDVPSSHWAFKYVQKLRELGITTGYGNGTYGLNDNVTRAQMAAFLIRSIIGDTFDYPTTPYFSDVDASHWAFKYIQKLRQLGITTGYSDGTYKPDKNVTRAEMAAFLTRTFLQPTYSLSASSPTGTLSADKGIIIGAYSTKEAKAACLLLTKQGKDYSNRDLEGSWRVHGLSVFSSSSSSSSSSIPLTPSSWTYGELTIIEGHYNGELYNSKGTKEAVSGTAEIDSEGKVTLKDNKGELFAEGEMASTKGIIFARAEKPATCYILTKEAEKVTLQELTGKWMLYEVVSGTETGWKKAEIDIAASGSYTGHITRSDGTSGNVTGKVTINPDGQISLSGNVSYAIFTNGVINSTKGIITATATDGDGNSNLIILIKKAKGYSRKDLTGKWGGQTFEVGKNTQGFTSISITNRAPSSKASSSSSAGKLQPKAGNAMSMDKDGRVIMTGLP